jgi:leucyl aminopeptidase (aminopeptidase T)
MEENRVTPLNTTPEADESAEQPRSPRLEVQAALENVLVRCLAVRPGESVVILVDSDTDTRVLNLLRGGLTSRGCTPVVVEMAPFVIPGSEVSPAVAATMRQCDAVIELTSIFIGSNQARRDANAEGVRYLAMPGVQLDTFRADGPLGVDFDELRVAADQVGELWTGASTFHLTTPAGTDLHGSVVGRPGRVLHGICRAPGSYMAPPDIEAGTAPIEGSTHGIAVIDADLLFMGVGPLTDPVALTFEEGRLLKVEGPESDRLTAMIERCNDERMTNLAEVSLGLNPAGHVCAVAMETESTLGTAHIALGNSIAYGGIVSAVAHLDCVMRDATLTLDAVPVPAVEIMSHAGDVS